MSNPKITQEMRYRESIVKYARKHGISKTVVSIKRTDNLYIVG